MPETDPEKEAKERLNTRVALVVTLLACFHGLAEVKAGNNMQAMQRLSASRVADTAQAAAARTRLELVEVMLTRARLEPSAAASKEHLELLSDLDAEQRRVETRAVALEAKVDRDAAEYERRDYHDDQFDLSQAGITASIGLLAMAALLSSNLLFGVAMVPALLGMAMGLAGFTGARLHPDMLIGWLT